MRYKHILYYFRSSTTSFAELVFYTDELDEEIETPTYEGWNLYSHSTEICDG